MGQLIWSCKFRYETNILLNMLCQRNLGISRQDNMLADTQLKDLFERSHNPSHSTLYPDQAFVVMHGNALLMQYH